MSSEKTRLSAKLRVRMPSKKIYGPYRREEVIEFIRIGKLQGEEEILFEGESIWRVLSSEPEFFDELQETISGVPRLKKKKGRIEKTEQSDPKPQEDLMGDDPTKILMDEKKALLSKDARASATEKAREASLSLPLNATDEQSAQKKQSSSNLKNQKRIRLIVAAVVFLGLGLFLLGPEQKSGEDLSFSYKDLRLPQKAAYVLALNEQLRGMRLPALNFPVAPQENGELQVGGGFGAQYWIREIRAAYDQQNSALLQDPNYWINLAWNAAWLGEVISNVDTATGDFFKKYSKKIREELKNRDALTEKSEKLFGVIALVNEGKWKEVHDYLQPLVDIEMARWLMDDARFMDFWEKDAKETLKGGSNFSFQENQLKIASLIRLSLVQKQKDLPQDVKQLLQFDSQSWIAWFSLAEFCWRVQGAGVSFAQRYFLAGMTVQSLYPRGHQRVFWEQYAKFQGLFGRANIVQHLEKNIEVLKASDRKIAADDAWWDLGQEGLQYNEVFQQILGRLEQSDLSLIDIASLEVFSRASPREKRGIEHVLVFAIFNRQWDWAERIFEEYLIKVPQDEVLLGLKSWFEAERFQFQSPFESINELNKKGSGGATSLLYNGILHIVGRSFEQGREDLNQYIKKFPQAGLAQYFLARSYFEEEKNVECTKSANLARIHGTGVVRFHSQLLYYRCRVLAQLGTEEALRELEAMLKQNPDSVPLTLEYVRGLVNAGKKYEALKSIETAVVRFPYSYQLKLMMGEVLEERDQKDEALLLYNEARKLRPDLAETGIAVAKLFEGEERYIEAAQNYETAALEDPNYPEIFLYAARAYRKAGNKEKAYVMYHREVELRPAVVETFIEASEFMLESNAPRLVPKLFQKYSETFRSDPRILIRLAQSYMAIREFKEAEKYAKLANSNDSQEPEPYRMLGEIYESQGQYQMARQNYQKYLALLPQAEDAGRIKRKLETLPF